MSHAPAAPVKYAGRSYIVECAVAMGLFVVMVLARHWLAAHAANRDLAMFATVIPALPLWLMFFVVWRHYRRIDEYKQKKMLEMLAISFGIGFCIVITYSFLTETGFPPLDIVWAGPVFAVTLLATRAAMSVASR